MDKDGRQSWNTKCDIDSSGLQEIWALAIGSCCGIPKSTDIQLEHYQVRATRRQGFEIVPVCDGC